MESRTKKMIPSKGINGFDDRLSDMPDHLIVHILSFLPTLDAVKTMLLRRFGSLWTLVPILVFDFEKYDRTLWPKERDLSVDESFSRFVRFVRNVLMLHRSSTIDRFHLFISTFEDYFSDPKIVDDVQMWLRFAIDRQVKDLNFFFDGLDDIAIPRCIFTSQSLVTLKLVGCVLEDQSHVHMGSLRELSLGLVEGSAQDFNQLISGCSSLKELAIDVFKGLHVLNITAPSVGKLCLSIHYIRHSVALSCPNVKVLDIDVSGWKQSYMVDVIDFSSVQVVNVKGLPSGSSSPVKVFLTQIRNVEVATFSKCAFEGLCSVIKIGFPQTRWKHLVLRPFWHDDRCVQVILELMKSSVKLEELIIYNYPLPVKFSNGSLDGSTTCTHVMPLLKKVTIHGSGRFTEAQLQLVEIVLGNAVVLEQLVINTGKCRLTAVNELNLVKQVSRFIRASATATVIFA